MSTTVMIQADREAFRFTSFQEWVNKAQGWFRDRIPEPARSRRRYLAVDAVGRVCMIGADFMRARDEETFPVVVFLLDSTSGVKGRPLGCLLAMRVMQSDLYPKLDSAERADCDELIQQNLEWFKRDGAPGVMGSATDQPKGGA